MRPQCFFFSFIFCCFGVNVFSQSTVTDPLIVPFADNEIQTVPTFNSCSYYNRPSSDVAFSVEYKRTDETVWHAAHATVCDQPEKIHKGSLFHLEEDTEYQIRTFAGDDRKMLSQTIFRTWSSAPRIAKTIDLSTLPDTAQNGIVITEQGTADAWIKYTAPANWIVKRTLREADSQDAAVVLKGIKYVILENLTIEGGQRNSILVDNCDFVRILNCDLSGWGRVGVQKFDNDGRTGQYADALGKIINYDGGVYVRRSFGTVIERCYVHDPRNRANAWTFSHPTGPQAVVADSTRGGNVIRWNDFVGSDEHRWNDVIECLSNDSPTGGLYRDSDVIGNFLSFGNDDAIELEGGGINLRFMGNKVEGTLCGISFGANMVGPQYAIGNLIVNLGDEEEHGIMFFKNSHGTEQKGKRFMYNNTLYSPNNVSNAFGSYGGATPVDAGLGTMRNNIFFCTGFSLGNWVRAENFDNDLFWFSRSLPRTEQIVASLHNYEQEKNALVGDPQFVEPSAGNYRLTPNSIARRKAVEVAGIMQDGDDLGAFFIGTTDIPLRPLALTTVPTQINFPSTGGTSTVALNLPAVVAPVTFQIRQNSVFDWFTVTPSHGTILPGETLELTVTANPAQLTGRPLFRGAFLVRTPNGLSRPVTVYAKSNYTEPKRPVSAGTNTVYVDAASGTANAPIEIPGDGVYSLLARISDKTVRRGNLDFNVSVNGKTDAFTVQSGAWYLVNGVERVVWLYSLGPLKAGPSSISIKSTNPNIGIVEYIVTDKPAAFFLQERNVRR